MPGPGSRVYRPRAATLLIPGLVAALLLCGCSPASSRFQLPVDADNPAVGVPLPAVPAEDRVRLDQIDDWTLRPTWTDTFSWDANVGIDISPLGDRVAVTSPAGRSSDLTVYDQDKQRIPPSMRFSNVSKLLARFLHDDGYLGVWTHDTDTDGMYRVYSPDGERLLTVTVSGTVTARMSGDATRVAIVEHNLRSMRVFDPRTQRLITSHTVTPGAVVTFIPGTNAVLVEDDRDLRVVADGGLVVRRFDIERELRRSVVLSPDGSFIAVTTGREDHALHVLGTDEDGDEIWSSLLLPGGNNDVMFSDDGAIVLVYNVGRRGGIYAFDSLDGTMLWRAGFDIDTATTLVTWQGFSFGAGGKYLVGHLRVREIPESVSDRNLLLIISMDGEFIAKAALGSRIEAELSRDGALLAVADGTTSSRLYFLNIVHFYDLRPLLETVRGAWGG